MSSCAETVMEGPRNLYSESCFHLWWSQLK
uniref:Uncharacterized protein MANES_02G226900 n=1 Tax=Rhizophora mucronata TaxID=61149 RepID=A0A2P2IIG9_RHIMU